MGGSPRLLLVAPPVLRAPRRWLSAAAFLAPAAPQLPAAAHLAPVGVATAGEQAWHRRARRQRQADRAIIAVAAARRRIACHHGGGGWPSGMSRRGGGNGGDGPLARQILELLQRQCGSDGGGEDGKRGRGANGRGALGRSTAEFGSPRRASSRAGSARGERQQQREGDWECRSCMFKTNFAFRQKCWRCGESRGGQQRAAVANGRNLSAGPIGANGLRPLLGGGASRPSAPPATSGPPTHRIPGSSLAAKAMAARAAVSTAQQEATASGKQQNGVQRNERPAALPGGAARMVDGEGFQLVQRRKPRQTGISGLEVPGCPPEHDEDAAMGDDADEDQLPHEGDDHDAEDDDEEPEVAPEPAVLRQRWQKEVGIVKQLTRQGLGSDHPAMVAACEARDEAERVWRGAKDPAPLASRLGWAQKKLDRAISIQSETRLAISALEKEYNQRKAELQTRMDTDTDRVKKRRQQLREVQDEAGGESPQQRLRGGGGEAVRKACGTLRDEVAPALTALAEQLGTGTEAWSTINGLLSTLTSSQKVLEEAMDGATPTFDMADGDQSEWSESHDLPTGVSGSASWYHGGADGQETQQQQAQQTSQQAQQQHPQCQQGQQWSAMGQLDSAQSGGGSGSWDSWGHAAWTAAPAWRQCGHGHWQRASWADAWECEQRGVTDADMDGQGEPPNKHRRQDSPVARTADPNAGPVAGDGAAATQAEQQGVQGQLQCIIAAAINAGVQPLTSTGEELHVLDANQLAAWAAENLPQ